MLFPFFMRPDDAPRVVNVAAYRLNSNDTRKAPEGYLADRNLYPITAHVSSSRDRVMLQQLRENIKPEWSLPKDKFSDWHYSVIRPIEDNALIIMTVPLSF